MKPLNPSIVAEYEQLLSDALTEITELQQRLQQKDKDTIAIVGAGMRFPGDVSDLAGFWQLLAKGQDTASRVPQNLWPVDEFYSPESGVKGKAYTDQGCFIKNVEQFDASFFGITPREAVAMDPQQRLLLEVSWEALENAGLAADRLVGSKTGVYIGLMHHDYASRIHESEELDVYLGTGNAASVAAGRISYFFGLQGPSMTVDTACSSSLTTIHLACQSLRRREIDLALAGGANLQLAPYTAVAESAAHMLAPDGKCKAFDKAADGFIRGDGVGVLALMRLEDAIAEKHSILAIIRGSAVNHDGASGGLTVPNGPAQVDVIRAALSDADISPQEVAYIEAHGTGTSLGDPIEIHALERVFAPHRTRDNSLWIGSVKTNIGHTESAAGIAGILKVVAMLQRQHILPQLHLRTLNPQIDWENMPIKVATQLMPWPSHYQRKIAGVSSFGLGGTNAHIILEQAPAMEMAVTDSSLCSLTITAKDPAALEVLVDRYIEFLAQHRHLSLSLICQCATEGRSRFSYQLSVTANSHDEMRAELRKKCGLEHFITINHQPKREKVSYQKMALPTYPFQRKPYWLEFKKEEAPTKNEKWVHAIQWQIINKPTITSDLSHCPWVIFADEGGIAKALFAELEAKQIKAYLIYVGERLEQRSKYEWEMKADSAVEFREFWSLLGLNEPVSLLYLWTLNQSQYSHADHPCTEILSQAMPLLYSIQNISALKAVYMVTLNAVATGYELLPLNAAHASLRGFLHVVHDEHPRVMTCHIDLDSLEMNPNLLLALCEASNLNQICCRQGKWYTPQIIARPPESYQIEAKPHHLPKAESSYLITGGLGGVGLLIAEWLVQSGARYLLLVSRSQIKDDTTKAKIQQLRSKATVIIYQADISDNLVLQKLLTDMEQTLPPLAGVIHAAGVLADAMLNNQTAEHFQTVLAAKVAGAWNLHRATLDRQLDFFILFSSVSSIFPAPGQSNYATANAYLDALAHYRKQLGLPALSINWGAWANTGMAAHLSKHHLEPIPTQKAIELMAQLLYSNMTQVIVMKHKLEQPLIKRSLPIINLPLFQRQQAIRDLVVQCISEVSAVDIQQLDDDKADLQGMGLDSLMAIEIRNKLSASLDIPLQAGLIFNYPSIVALTDYLLDSLKGSLNCELVPNQGHFLSARDNEAIAIIGMSCRFPGGANTPEQFWQNLAAGMDCIVDIGKKRWVVEHVLHTGQAGLLEQIDKFDCQFFGITPREVECMDPQQRILLELAWEAIERAGYAMDCLQGCEGGVFIGPSPNEYVRLCGSHSAELAAHVGTGNHNSVTAGRISYHFGWQGPSLALDTACSSALVAVHMACQSLRQKECNIALAGGINLMLLADTSLVLSKSQMLSSSGRCHTFAASADGYVRAEGAGMVLLKPLDQALSDDDPIIAVIRGSAVNQDGHSQGLTAPNGPAQERVMKKALKHAGVKPEEVSYIEAHGTGTPLGDPIEVHALDQVYGQAHAGGNPLWLGSVKTNIGHTEAAAGIAGLFKTTLSLMHQAIPAHLHFNEPNPLLGTALDRMIIPTALTAWEATSSPRLAAVSSFGFSGTNVHMIVEEWPQDKSPDERGAVFPVTLSAKTQTALQAMAEDYLQFFIDSTDVSLLNVSFTSTMGRMHHEKRVVFLCRTLSELCEGLQAYCSNQYAPSYETVEQKLQEQLEYYQAGKTIDWSIFYKGYKPQKIILPTYPFERQRVWPRSSPQEIYRQNLSAQEPYPFADHQLNQVIVVPGAAHIAFMIAAAHQAHNQFNNILFTHPLVLTAHDSKPYQLIITEQKITGLSLENDQWHAHMIAEIGNDSWQNYPILEKIDYANYTQVTAALFYQKMQQGGYFLGEHFQWIKELYYKSGEAIALLRAPDVINRKGYLLPPGLIDSFLQTTALAKENADDLSVRDELFVPYSLERFQIYSDSIEGELICCARLLAADSETYTHDLLIYDQAGQVVIAVNHLISKRVSKVVSSFVPHSALSSILHQQEWQEINPQFKHITTSGHCLIVVSQETSKVYEFVTCLKNLGRMSTLVEVQSLSDSEAVESLLNTLPQLTHVCFAFALADQLSEQDVSETIQQLAVVDLYVLTLVQALIKRTQNKLPSISIVTRCCQKINVEDPLACNVQATLWGLGRSLQQEHPEFQCQLIDLDMVDSPQGLEQLAKLCINHDTAKQLAIRENKIYVPHLTQIPKNNLAAAKPLSIHADGSYLITGGLGEIGFKLCAWLIDLGAQSITLVSRSQANVAQLAQINEWQAQGYSIVAKNIDITCAKDLAALLQELPSLRGVIHAAGLVEDHMLINQTPAAYRRVLAPKIQGAWLLHQLTRHLDFFVLFSSAASILGTKGQANYAAANAYLDYLACYRHGHGLPALSVNWGPFAEFGMARNLFLDAVHLLPIPLGFRALHMVMGLPLPQTVIMPHVGKLVVRDQVAIIPLQQQLEGLSIYERKTYVYDLVSSTVCHTLRLSHIEPHQSLLDLGVDSLLAVDLRNILNQKTAVSLAVTFIFKYPTVQSITDFLLSELSQVAIEQDEERLLDQLSTEELANSLHALLS